MTILAAPTAIQIDHRNQLYVEAASRSINMKFSPWVRRVPLSFVLCIFWTSLAIATDSSEVVQHSVDSLDHDLGNHLKVAGAECSPMGSSVCNQPRSNSCSLYPQRSSLAHGQSASSFGVSYHAMMQTQIAKGEAAQMVLYQYDFIAGEPVLNYRGRTRLLKMSKLLFQNDFPIIIEAACNNPALDQARRSIVIAEMQWFPYPLAAERIIIGSSPTRGLDGIDAEIIHQNLLGLTFGQAADAPANTSGAVRSVPVR
jgi:hypothetical protein